MIGMMKWKLSVKYKSAKEFGIIKENTIRTIMYNSNIKEEISELIFNKEKINQLLTNSAAYLSKYISNQGNASKILLDEIIRN